MPAKGGASATMTEGLKSLLGDIAEMTVLPDADPKFLQGLQQAITTYVRQRTQQTAAGVPGNPGQPGQGPLGQSPGAGGPGGPGAGGPPGGGGPGGPPPGQPNQIAPGGGAGMSGLFGPAATPNPDELRRILAGSVPPG